MTVHLNKHLSFCSLISKVGHAEEIEHWQQVRFGLFTKLLGIFKHPDKDTKHINNALFEISMVNLSLLLSV